MGCGASKSPVATAATQPPAAPAPAPREQTPGDTSLAPSNGAAADVPAEGGTTNPAAAGEPRDEAPPGGHAVGTTQVGADDGPAAEGAAAGGAWEEVQPAPSEASTTEVDVPYEPLTEYLSCGREGDVKYRAARVKSRDGEPCSPPLELPEDADIKRVWQEEWYGFPAWSLVLLTRAATGKRLWKAMSNDRRRAACERFALCGPWAASQEPDAEQLARMRATSSSSLFVLLEHPARRELFMGAFCSAHGLAKIVMLKSDRPLNPSYWDEHRTTDLGVTMTTAEVCHRIVVPATRAFGASYVDLYLGPELWGESGVQSLRQSATGRFLSHAWGMPFMQLVSIVVVEGSPPSHDRGPYWIDIFCKNQHVPIQESDLTNNIECSRKGVLLAVYPWPAPLLTTRVWCLFEILTALQTKVSLELKFCDGAAAGLRGALHGRYNAFTYHQVRRDVQSRGLSSVLPGASELIAGIDVRQAIATVPSDRGMIMGLIERGIGAEEMNKQVAGMLTVGLTEAIAGVVESIEGQGRLDYNSYQGY